MDSMSMTYSQPDFEIPFSDDIRSSDWFYMKTLLADLQRQLADGKRYFLRIVSRWVQAYEMLRAFEEVVMIGSGEPSQAERQFLIGNIAILKGYGIHILRVQESNSLDIPPSLGVSAGDLMAMIEELEALEYAYPLKPIPAAKKALFQKIFGDGKRPKADGHP